MGNRDPDVLEGNAARALDARLAKYEREVVKNYSEALKDIRADIAKVYERYSDNGSLTYAEMSRFNRLTKLEKQLTEDIMPALGKDQRLIEKMQAVEYDEAFYRYAWTIDQQSGVALRWGTLSTATVLASVANPLTEIATTRLRTGGILRVRRVVTQGLIRGLSYPAMMRAIKDVVIETRKGSLVHDALRIVRTEGQRAQVLGQQATYEKAADLGVEGGQVWNATLDTKTRDDHGALDGVIAEEDEGGVYWNTAVGRVAGPMQSGVASFDINCRCRVSYRIEGYEPEVRRVRDEGLVPYKTYDQWADERGLKRNRYGQPIRASERRGTQ